MKIMKIKTREKMWQNRELICPAFFNVKFELGDMVQDFFESIEDILLSAAIRAYQEGGNCDIIYGKDGKIIRYNPDIYTEWNFPCIQERMRVKAYYEFKRGLLDLFLKSLFSVCSEFARTDMGGVDKMVGEIALKKDAPINGYDNGFDIVLTLGSHNEKLCGFCVYDKYLKKELIKHSESKSLSVSFIKECCSISKMTIK